MSEDVNNPVILHMITSRICIGMSECVILHMMNSLQLVLISVLIRSIFEH